MASIALNSDTPSRTTRSARKKSSSFDLIQQNVASPRRSGRREIIPNYIELNSGKSNKINNTRSVINTNSKVRQCDKELEEVDVIVVSDDESDEKTVVTPRKKKQTDTDLIAQTTPPKQKRHNNENELFSPSSLLSKLHLESPKKVESSSFTPKSLFESNSTYKSARKALHSTLPVQMPGRETEHEGLKEFITSHLNNETSGTLYVSGPPGTGKTASLSMILQEPDIAHQFKEVYVNCTAIKSAGAIFSRIVSELNLKTDGKGEKDCVDAIEKHLIRSGKMILLVLDEIDQLESKKQSVLYTIFEWPSRKGAKLILIGIANALDLTDRTLPRLQARCELKPKLMHFAPYTKQQIVNIFTNRLKEAGVLQLFSPAAIQMLSGKVAAISGDVRKALDIGRRVIEIVEQHKKQETLKPLESNEQETKQVDLKHVVNVLNNVYGTTESLNSDSNDTFPIQQKIIVCTLLLILKKGRKKDVNLGKLHEIYKKICTKMNLLAVDHAEFAGICSLIETRGIMKVSGKKDTRLHKVSLEWDLEEVASVLKDKQLMSRILDDDSVLT